MKAAITTGVLGLALLAGAGCNSYEKERPPVDQLDSRDEGLQSKEVVNASDKMAASILRSPKINNSKEQLLIVVDHMDDDTQVGFPKDIFLRRLKTAIGQQGEGRIQLIENKDRLRGMQSRELEGGGAANDEFGQGGGAHAGAPGPAGLQPDYALNGRITELAKQGTSYFYLEFNLTGLKGADARKIVWTDDFEVKVAK
jgi:hypothetical protein